MEIKLADNAGFCFGVKRAMKLAWDEICSESDNGVYAYGPLIHNKQAVEKYEERGLKTVDNLEDIPSDSRMIIRSHGVGKYAYDYAVSKKLDIVDTTCPFVKKIHDIVKEYHDKGFEIIVIGDSKHPEVIGINGWCNDSANIIKTVDAAKEFKVSNDKEYCIVAQTTMNVDVYREIVSILEGKIDNIYINNTICSATKTRQEAASKLAEKVDCMIVIGGKHSSNTQKLVGICEKFCDTFAIETKEELDKNVLSGYNSVGVTAGASTPDWIINDVLDFIKSI